VRVTLRYSAAEYADIRDAATAVGVTATNYAAHAAIAAARGAGSVSRTNRPLMLELLATRAQLRRYGNNLNQAARILTAGGEPPEWLKNAVALTQRVVEDIDRAVEALVDPPCGRAQLLHRICRESVARTVEGPSPLADEAGAVEKW
jgi:hypothetical protein